MDRIKILCSYLEPCKVFADVACDHGYCAEYMLESGLCESAIISDISAQCLKKAETLLSDYIKSGKCRSVCCDGLKEIDGADEVLISGIGGEEIIKILKEGYIPERFVFQPMKNSEALRAYLLENVCKIESDDIFKVGKNYYFIIRGRASGGTQGYTATELKYGKDSLKNPVLVEYLNGEIEKNFGYLAREMTEENRKSIEKKISFMRGVINGEIT